MIKSPRCVVTHSGSKGVGGVSLPAAAASSAYLLYDHESQGNDGGEMIIKLLSSILQS